jgi:hypothetical protein
MNATKNKYLEKFAKRRDTEHLSKTKSLVFSFLHIDKNLHRDEVVYALGYPDAQHEYGVVTKWMESNEDLLLRLTPYQGAQKVLAEFSFKLDAYFGENDWRRPDQYER